jgi:hypothetical protein
VLIHCTKSKVSAFLFFFTDTRNPTPESSTLTPETLKSGACRLGFHKLHHSITPADYRIKERPALEAAQSLVLRAWILYYHLLIFFTSARVLFSGLKLSF